MKKAFLAITSIVMLLVMSACGSSDSGGQKVQGAAPAPDNKAASTGSKQTKVDTLVIAYLPNEAKEELATARQGLAKDMEAALHVKVKEFLASDYNAAIEAMRTGKADIANFGPLSYSQAHERSKAEPLVVPAEDGKVEKSGYYSYLVASAKNDKINSIPDLKGKKFAFVDANSTSGNLVPSFEILKAVNDSKLTFEDLHTNGKFFDSVTFSGAHQNGLQAVVKGDIDAAPVASDIFEREVQAGRLDKNAVKIIFKSSMIPGSPIGIRGDLPDDVKKEVRDFLVKYDNDKYFTDFVGQKPGQKIRYAPIDDSAFKDIYDLRKKFNL